MIFQRQFKFYASHRNQHLKDKCACLHGHRYDVTYELEMTRDLEKGQHVTTLFADLDSIGEHIHKILDHSCMMDWNDPLALILRDFAEGDIAEGKLWKFAYFPFPTSAENLAFAIFDMMEDFIRLNFPIKLKKITLRETDSTLIHYDEFDHERDDVAFVASGETVKWFDFSLISNEWPKPQRIPSAESTTA